MCRIALQVGPLTIYSYGLLLMVGFLAATWLAQRDAAHPIPGRTVLTPPQFVDAAMLALVGGLFGGRLFFVIQHWDLYHLFPAEIAAIWHGGLIWYGGLLGGVAAALGYLLWRKIPVWRGLDQMIPYVVLAHAIGRVGCFLNGCCYGSPTSAWYGVHFPQLPEPVIPTQLIEAAALGLGFLGLRRLQRAGWAGIPGRTFATYLAGYALLRFALEFLRGDQRVRWATLTLQQWISVAALALGLGLLARRRGGGRARAER